MDKRESIQKETQTPAAAREHEPHLQQGLQPLSHLPLHRSASCQGQHYHRDRVMSGNVLLQEIPKYKKDIQESPEYNGSEGCTPFLAGLKVTRSQALGC